jgi:hypothetical protein
MFNGLDNFVQQSLQRDMQNKMMQAQLQAKEAEKHLVSKKYDSGYPGVFGAMTNALDDASIAYGNRFNETIRSKQSFTQELLTKVWDDGMHVDHTRYLNDIRSYCDMMNIHKMKVTACTTLAEADLEFSKTEDQYNKFFSDWKIKTAESSNRWSAHFDKLVIEANNPVAEVAQNVPNQNPVPQGGDDLLQQLNALQQQLAQKDGIINSLAQGMQIAQGAIVQAQQIIQEKDIKIADQKVTIDDLREDKIELREKVNEQKIKIDTLTDTNLEQVEKIHQVSNKYLDLKAHFVDLVTLHQEADPDYFPVVDLAGLNLDQ